MTSPAAVSVPRVLDHPLLQEAKPADIAAEAASLLPLRTTSAAVAKGGYPTPPEANGEALRNKTLRSVREKIEIQKRHSGHPWLTSLLGGAIGALGTTGVLYGKEVLEKGIDSLRDELPQSAEYAALGAAAGTLTGYALSSLASGIRKVFFSSAAQERRHAEKVVEELEGYAAQILAKKNEAQGCPNDDVYSKELKGIRKGLFQPIVQQEIDAIERREGDLSLDQKKVIALLHLVIHAAETGAKNTNRNLRAELRDLRGDAIALSGKIVPKSAMSELSKKHFFRLA